MYTKVGVAQRLERSPHKAQAEGSTPSTDTLLNYARRF